MKPSMCIVGCGEQAAKVLSQTGDMMTDQFDLYFASERPEDAHRYCSSFRGSGTFQDHEEAADDPRIDAMYFTTPHHVHLEQALYAASRSKHILMEKPIARSLSEARQIIRAAHEAGVTLMVSEPVRYLASVAKCKQLMAEGAIGEIKLVHVQNEHYSLPLDWRLDWEQRGGGELVDGGIHSVDILLNIGGFSESVYAAEPRKVFADSEGEDGMVVVVDFPGGAVGILNISAATATAQGDQWVVVTGSHGQLRFAPSGSAITLGTAEGVRSIPVQENKDSLQRMMREFYGCVKEGRRPVMSGEEGAKDLALVVAAYESLQRGDRVPVPTP